jgi:superfamily II DNA/RNA helicase
MHFAELGLSEKTLRSVLEVGYHTPTPIQEQVIPYVLKRCDVFGCAQTGTGKTASFTLPLLDILDSGRARARMPRILILAPTRELANQVASSFSTYGRYHKFNLLLAIGGESIYEQERKLTYSVDVLIATPGRLVDLFERGKVMFHALEVIVIDEADRMLDMGFIPDVEKIFSLLPNKRQTLMFSATVSEEVKKLSHAFLRDFVELTVNRPSEAAKTIQQYVVPVTPKDKTKTLRCIIQKENVKNAIIFCNRKKSISTLCTSLKRYGYNVAPLHGDLHQTKRTETLSAFKRGEIHFLVASDVAARGIDIEDLDYVFNFDVPVSPEEYIHRIGRTGRAGRLGSAFMFVTQEENTFLKSIQNLLRSNILTYTVSLEKKESEQKIPNALKSQKKETSSYEQQLYRKAKQTFPDGPVVGFGDRAPAFMKNYFPNLDSTITVSRL